MLLARGDPLRANVHHALSQRHRARAASDAVAPLQNHHAQASLKQPPRTAQPRRPSANHAHVGVESVGRIGAEEDQAHVRKKMGTTL